MAATETQVGKARIFGLDGATVVTLVGAAFITLESADFEDQHDNEEIKGQNGDVETIIASNQRYAVNMQFAPAGGGSGGANSRSQAATSAVNMLAAPITKVVTSGFSIGVFNQNWNVMPGTTIRMTRDGTAIMTMKLIHHITNSGTGAGQLQSGVISG